jgi:hypothetical protein
VAKKGGELTRLFYAWLSKKTCRNKTFCKVASSFSAYFAAGGKNLVDKRANIPDGCSIA